MMPISEGAGARACWFVGAAYGGSDDQTARFLEEGIWENGYRDRYLDAVKSIQPGDRIAIKSSYTRKHNLPFDNRGYSVSVMAIKATGTVMENHGDGRRVKVSWTRIDPPREWYFYTYRGTIWRVLPGDWAADALIGFAFGDRPQDLAKFRNAAYWRERYGDRVPDRVRFHWTPFYEAVANKLLGFKDDRVPLIAAIHEIAGNVEGLTNLQDQYEDGATGPLEDICPFTAMGIFNRNVTDANRKVIAAELARFLGVEEPVPEKFDGIPFLNNQKSWFFGFKQKRSQDDIDVLWSVFARAIEFADSDNPDSRSDFADAYDEATKRWGVGWNLTMGLYWIRPWVFPTLDTQSRIYIEKKLGIQIGRNGPKERCNASDYLTVLGTLEARFQEEAYPVHSFPELSLAAWLFKADEPSAGGEEVSPGGESHGESEGIEDRPASPISPYAIDDIITDGCFLDRGELEGMLERLLVKKNLILQGPPGTGKTWLAKRLAFAFVGQRKDSVVRAVQFHPNLSYEDFVRGWRPCGDGRLSLVDGPFMEMVIAASKAPGMRHVVVIEEINRANPAQVFGEMLTLLEADKRTPTEALELCYRRNDGERVFVPDNLYLIGTMNIADRSIAMVDLAFRRRFAFVGLEPMLGTPWKRWLVERCGFDPVIPDEIEQRILKLNETISSDSSLGRQFRIGHSYVTPPFGTSIGDARGWFRQVVETEIGPLLDEYWFDDLDRSRKARQDLIEGL